MIVEHTQGMDDMATRLRKLRTDKRVSQRELSRRTGIEQATLSRIERGEMSLLSPHVKKISDALGVPISKVLGIVSNISPAQVGSRRVPILSYGQACTSQRPGHDAEDLDIMDFVLVDLPHSAGTFALRIEGDSMQPTFNPGDVVVIDPEVSARPGDFVFASDIEEECTFKRYKDLGVNDSGNKVFELIPLNKLYATLRSDRNCCVIKGVMVEHRIYRKPS